MSCTNCTIKATIMHHKNICLPEITTSNFLCSVTPGKKMVKGKSGIICLAASNLMRIPTHADMGTQPKMETKLATSPFSYSSGMCYRTITQLRTMKL